MPIWPNPLVRSTSCRSPRLSPLSEETFSFAGVVVWWLWSAFLGVGSAPTGGDENLVGDRSLFRIGVDESCMYFQNGAGDDAGMNEDGNCCCWADDGGANWRCWACGAGVLLTREPNADTFFVLLPLVCGPLVVMFALGLELVLWF